MDKGIFSLVVLILESLLWLVSGLDPCDEAINISDVRRAATNQEPGNSYLCDSYRIQAGRWYTLEHSPGDRLADSCPREYSCGTMAPLYLDGSHPTVDNPGPITATVAQSFGGNCYYWTANISIKLCTSSAEPPSYVYQLQPPPYCESAYCTENTATAVHLSTPPSATTDDTMPEIGTISQETPTTGDDALDKQEITRDSQSDMSSTAELVTGSGVMQTTSQDNTDESARVTTSLTHASTSVENAPVSRDSDANQITSLGEDTTINQHDRSSVTPFVQKNGDEIPENSHSQMYLIIGVLGAVICVLVIVVIVFGFLRCRRSTPDKAPSGQDDKKVIEPTDYVYTNDYQESAYLEPCKRSDEPVYHYIEDSQYESIKEGHVTKPAQPSLPPLSSDFQQGAPVTYECLASPGSDTHVYRGLDNTANTTAKLWTVE